MGRTGSKPWELGTRRSFLRLAAGGLGGCLWRGAAPADEAAGPRRPASGDTVRVACVAMHSKMGEPAANLHRVEEWSLKAHKAGAALAVFPEECITGSRNKSGPRPQEAA